MRKRQNLTNIVLIDLLREEKATLLPPWGGWVCIVGNPYAPRGRRIEPSIHKLGVHHMDIYYAYNEECPWRMPSRADMSFVDRSDVIDAILQVNMINDLQLTWMTLHTPNSELIRMWKGEVRLFDEQLIKDMLAVDYLEVVPFGTQQTHPVWDETTRDMIGSLQLDGLSYQEAQFELITAGVEFERDPQLPPYYFRAIGEYKERFSEENI